MAETDIFNPTDWQAAGFAFNPNPSYGFTRKMGANRQIQRPRLGIYPVREIMNGGHIFSLGWINTDITTAQRVINFYHSFKSGYFTLIDQDWNGRQYVGRFMNEPELSHPANAKYSFSGVIFEEMPRARMLTYPTPDLYGYPLNVVDDYLNPRVALMQGSWVIQISPIAGVGTLGPAPTISTPAALEAYNAAAVVGDYAATSYTGFGFQAYFRLNNNLGTISISLDGIPIVATFDLSNGAYTGATSGVTIILEGGSAGIPRQAIVTCTDVSLDAHVVQIAAVGPSSGSTASGYSTWGIVFPAITFIY